MGNGRDTTIGGVQVHEHSSGFTYVWLDEIPTEYVDGFRQWLSYHDMPPISNGRFAIYSDDWQTYYESAADKTKEA